MNDWILKDEHSGNERHFDSRSEAEEAKQDLESIAEGPLVIEQIDRNQTYGPGTPCSQCGNEIEGSRPEDTEYCAECASQTRTLDSSEGYPGTSAADNLAQADSSDTEVVEATQTAAQKLDGRNVTDDPLDYMPSHFLDTIQGVPTINRKGYAVIAAEYGISVKAEPIELPHENGFEYACFRAIAETPEGERYSGIGTANVDRQDGDDRHLLAELAETRAMKRATAWATGVGVTAIEEMQGKP